ncbi:porin [Paraburkholderia acidipaludis]|uniref:porin n=1 Tax=Paraburkholderia acidipaludis TaxID=660537 RepID=UPI001FE23927|nr:porin [Paraburkholderia acidipaludis]
MNTRRMTKGIAVSALLLACGLAKAQSNVTLYGLLDEGLLYSSKTQSQPSPSVQAGPHQISMLNGGGMVPSIFGVNGSEDLGGGYKATFKLESGISLSNGGFSNTNGGLFGRFAWVGLEGPIGALRLGLQMSPFEYAIADSDVLGLALFGGPEVSYSDYAFATGTFVANAITYTSPKIGGLTASAMFAPGGVAGNFQAGREYSMSLKYEIGQFIVDAAFFDGNSNVDGLTSQFSPTAIELEPFIGKTIGLSWFAGSLTTKASFTSYKVAGYVDYDVYNVGMLYAIRPNWYVNGEASLTSDRNQTQNHSIMGELGTEFYLSRRTSLYGEVGVVNNHGQIYSGLQVDNALFSPANGTTVSGEVGFRHTF